MDFVIQWLWYLLAFVAGSAVAWLIARSVNRTSDEDNAADVVSKKIGADW
ncbi:MAG TPA: hypothetical protein VLL82_11015 [Mycobacterium sp.]|jgi:uncharacterized membrane protein ArfB|nr:hypothetical protein [Mycobacterium sp.]